MTIALDENDRWSRAGAIVRRVNLALVVFLAFYLAIGLLQPTYLEPSGMMNFLRRAAPLAILASGQLFVLVSGGFDLSVGSLVTLTVIGSSMLTANDPSKTWWAIGASSSVPSIRSYPNRQLGRHRATNRPTWPGWPSCN